MRNRNKRKEPEELTFWQSYSDMMAAMLLVFVLIIVFTITMAKRELENEQAKLEAERIRTNQIQETLDEKQEQLDRIVGVKSDIITELKKEFEDTELGLSVDPSTGAISFDSQVLFDYNKYELKAGGIEFLNQFFPQYFSVIFREDIRGYISEVIIEGHTDNVGEYLYNLDLSQKRAFAVAEYCLGDNNQMFTENEIESLREIVTANGRAYYDLIYDEDGNVDADASRRVEVKFRLTEDEMIEELSNILEN